MEEDAFDVFKRCVHEVQKQELLRSGAEEIKICHRHLERPSGEGRPLFDHGRF
jgi:hypothetical protein